MDDKLDDFVNNLQEQIFKETKATYGETVFQRWLNPVYMGNIEDPDAYAHQQGTCGDSIEIFLKFNADRVAKASFTTD